MVLSVWSAQQTLNWLPVPSTSCSFMPKASSLLCVHYHNGPFQEPCPPSMFFQTNVMPVMAKVLQFSGYNVVHEAFLQWSGAAKCKHFSSFRSTVFLEPLNNIWVQILWFSSLLTVQWSTIPIHMSVRQMNIMGGHRVGCRRQQKIGILGVSWLRASDSLGVIG